MQTPAQPENTGIPTRALRIVARISLAGVI